jgi:hypothetical protein
MISGENTMQANKKNVFFLIQLAMTFLMSGCTLSQKPVGVTFLPDSDQAYQGDSVAKRFEEPTPQDQAVAGPMIELSEKYAVLSRETAALRLKNQDLVAENRQLKDQLAALDSQLGKTEGELTEANDLLMEMIVELNNWKTDVIGFREEMRGAEKAQLEALLKILKVLGGEVKAELAQGEHAGSDAISLSGPAQPQLKNVPTIGEPNE